MKPFFGIYFSIFPGLRNIFGALCICLSIVLCNSCEKPKSYSPIPVISVKGYTLIDTDQIIEKDTNRVRLLTLTFNFVDGDGNISDAKDRPLAVLPNDTSKKEDTTTYSKIYLKFFEKKQGIYFPVSDSVFKTPPVYPIPYGNAMSREGQNKTQKGEMAILYPFYSLPPDYKMPFDTLRIDLYIEDLAYEKSNVISFTDIALKKK